MVSKKLYAGSRNLLHIRPNVSHGSLSCLHSSFSRHKWSSFLARLIVKHYTLLFIGLIFSFATYPFQLHFARIPLSVKTRPHKALSFTQVLFTLRFHMLFWRLYGCISLKWFQKLMRQLLCLVNDRLNQLENILGYSSLQSTFLESTKV